MQGQLSLEFIVILALCLGYLSFSIALTQRMGKAIVEKAQEIAMRNIADRISFAARARGRFSFRLSGVPGQRFAVWSDSGKAVIESCVDGKRKTLETEIKSESGKRPGSCDDFPDAGEIVITNYGVVEIEGPVVD